MLDFLPRHFTAPDRQQLLAVPVDPDGHKAVAIAGDAPDPGFQMTLAGRPLADVRMRVDYMRPGDESWFGVAPAIAGGSPAADRPCKWMVPNSHASNDADVSSQPLTL